MEFLIKEAFKYVDGLGQRVDMGHYDLLGPQGDIILPAVWEAIVEPGWTVTMHMWPDVGDKDLETDLGRHSPECK